MSADFEINQPNPNKPDEGILRSQEVKAKMGIVEKRDDLLKNPPETSDSSMDDLHRSLDNGSNE
jgi:hypothetical protein